MYKSIVFDLGGVMIDFDPRGYLVDRLCNAETEEEVCRLEQAINHDIMYVAAIAQSERVKPPTGWDPLGR